MMNWLEGNYLDRVLNSVVAGTSDQDSDRVDMQTVGDGADEITFLLLLGDVTDTSALEIQVFEHTADAASGTQITSSNCTFTAGASSADNKIMACTVKRSKITKRYLWARIKRGTANAVIDGVLAVVSGVRSLSVTQSADVIKQATLAA